VTGSGGALDVGAAARRKVEAAARDAHLRVLTVLVLGAIRRRRVHTQPTLRIAHAIAAIGAAAAVGLTIPGRRSVAERNAAQVAALPAVAARLRVAPAQTERRVRTGVATHAARLRAGCIRARAAAIATAKPAAEVKRIL